MAVAVDTAELRIEPSLEEARELAEKGNVVPIRTRFIDDCETPVSGLVHLRGPGGRAGPARPARESARPPRDARPSPPLPAPPQEGRAGRRSRPPQGRAGGAGGAPGRAA